VWQILDAVRSCTPESEVHAAFIELVEPDVRTALAGLPAGARAVVVPLLLASGYHDKVDLPAAVDAARPGTPRAAVLGPDPLLAVALADRLDEAGRRPDDAVVLAAAGSSDAAAVDSVRTQAALLAAELGGRTGRPVAVTVGFGSAAAPDVGTAVAAARPRRVAVAPYLLAPGFFADRLTEAGADLVAAPLGPHPAVAELIRQRFLDAARSSI
jgi:sirohydrochlorin ferrochelatase